MIGCVLTGHGNFSKGMLEALEMIAGNQEGFEIVPFLEEESLEKFETKMSEAMTSLSKKYSGVIAFTDLLGGTPFRVAMVASQEVDNISVVTGTNLPMLVEGSILRMGETNAKDLADALVETGQAGLQVVNFPSNESASEEGDGI